MKTVQINDGIMLMHLNKVSTDLKDIENRRFMYHPDGWLVLGAEATASYNQLLWSHAREYYDAGERTGVHLPPYDDFVKGWIGVDEPGGKYQHGIIHFAPHIPDGHVELFEKAFSFIEAALENGFDRRCVLRGFTGAWEQTVADMLGEHQPLDKVISTCETDRLYNEWNRGNVYLYEGCFYDTETGRPVGSVAEAVNVETLKQHLADEMIIEFDSPEAGREYFNTYDGQNFHTVEDMKRYQGPYGFGLGDKWYHINFDEALDVYTNPPLDRAVRPVPQDDKARRVEPVRDVAKKCPER